MQSFRAVATVALLARSSNAFIRLQRASFHRSFWPMAVNEVLSLLFLSEREHSCHNTLAPRTCLFPRPWAQQRCSQRRHPLSFLQITVQQLKEIFDGEEVVASESVLTLESVQMIDVRGSSPTTAPLLASDRLVSRFSLTSEACLSIIQNSEPDELMVANYPTPGMDNMAERPLVHLPLSTMEEWGPKVGGKEWEISLTHVA
jgi:hypothetical protein